MPPVGPIPVLTGVMVTVRVQSPLPEDGDVAEQRTVCVPTPLQSGTLTCTVALAAAARVPADGDGVPWLQETLQVSAAVPSFPTVKICPVSCWPALTVALAEAGETVRCAVGGGPASGWPASG